MVGMNLLNSLLDEAINSVLEDTADKFNLQQNNLKDADYQRFMNEDEQAPVAPWNQKSTYQSSQSNQPQYHAPKTEQPQYQYSRNEQTQNPPETDWSQFQTPRNDQSQYQVPIKEQVQCQAPDARQQQFQYTRNDQSQYQDPRKEQTKYQAPDVRQQQFQTPRADQSQYQVPKKEQAQYKSIDVGQQQFQNTRTDQYQVPTKEQVQYQAPDIGQSQFQNTRDGQSQYQVPRPDQSQYQYTMNDPPQYQSPSGNQPEYQYARKDQSPYEAPKGDRTQYHAPRTEESKYQPPNTNKPEVQWKPETQRTNKNDYNNIGRTQNTAPPFSKKTQEDSQESFQEKYERFRSQMKNQSPSSKKGSCQEIYSDEVRPKTSHRPPSDTPKSSKVQEEVQQPSPVEDGAGTKENSDQLVPEKFKEPKVVTRGMWGALPTLDDVPRTEKPADTVVFSFNIGASPCETPKECMRRVRETQAKNLGEGLADIQYSFLLGGDGYIYEGRGWDHESGAKREPGEGPNLNIGFIGQFKNDASLPQVMLDNAQDLIMFSHKVGLLQGANSRTEVKLPKK